MPLFLTFQCPFNRNSDKDIQQSQDAQGQLLSSDSFHSNAASLKGSCRSLREKKIKTQDIKIPQWWDAVSDFILFRVLQIPRHVMWQFALRAELDSPQIQGQIQVRWCLRSAMTKMLGSPAVMVTIINMWVRLGNGCGNTNKNARKSNHHLSSSASM